MTVYPWYVFSSVRQRAGWGMAAVLLCSGLQSPAAAQEARPLSPPSDTEALAQFCASAVTDLSCTKDGKSYSYWLSLTAQAMGQKWYTAVMTVNELEDGEPAFVAPGTTLGLAQITYAAHNGEWHPVGQQDDFGRIYTSGAAGNPPFEDDGSSPSYEKPLADGTIIGLPLVRLAVGGVMLRSYGIFRTQPGKQGRWQFAGEIASGGDNGADCLPDEAPDRCYGNRGTLTETGRVSQGGWPEFAVPLQGTLPDEHGKSRAVTAQDAAHWRFDPQHGRYAIITPVR